MRIIFVPQYPTAMRYQEWWFWKLPKEFKKAGFDVHVLGQNAVTYMKAANGGMFSPVESAIDLETAQIKEYAGLTLRDDDILFLADLSFPGLFANVLFHKRPKRCFAYCHATSMNILDYFEKDRSTKFPIETAQSKLFDRVFIGSKYHQNKLTWRNTLVTRLPYPPLESYNEEKEFFIVSASRPTPQKVDIVFEKELEMVYRFPIVRQDSRSWKEYYKFLSKSKVLLITSWEDTFGYQIVDAVLNHCIPIAPNRCAYPELLPPECLYDSEKELVNKLKYLSGLEVTPAPPEILCHQEMKDFYKNIIDEIKGESKDYPF
jgi:hypothetical protein